MRHDNPHPLLPLDVSYHGVFDLCVEALSDREKRGVERDMVVKKAEYAAGGVPEYFIVHHAPEGQAFFRLGRGGLYEPIAADDGVVRSSVLPGFQFRITDLSDQPGPEQMCRDPVYAGFVLPGWRELEQRAREASARADAEAEARREEAVRADAQAQRANAEAARADAAERELAALRERLAGG